MENRQIVSIDCAAVLFDLDGVLIDSTACIERHWRQWAHAHGLDVGAVMRVAHGRRTVETMQLAAPHLDDVEAEARYFVAQEALDTEGVFEIDGATALLNALPLDSWAIVTSGSRDVATSRLNHVGLPIPRVLITADDVIQGKPDPEPYLAAAHRLGLEAEQCVVFEDSPAGLAAAHAAGMQAVALATTHRASELGRACVIAERLRDIQIDAGSRNRLSIWVSGATAGAAARALGSDR